MQWTTLLRLVGAVMLACAVEGFLIGILATNPPDPPLGIGDIVLIGSQFPGMFIGGLVVKTLGIPMSNENTWITLFTFQLPFYILACYYLFKFVIPRIQRFGLEDETKDTGIQCKR